MNPLVKIIYTIINSISRSIENLDSKTSETIRQAFFFTIFLLMACGIFLGNHLGKKSAKHSGEPLSETTNQSFDTDIKRSRERGSFKNMLKEELMREAEKSGNQKIPYPAREEEPIPMNDALLEAPGTEKERSGLPPAVDRDRPVDIQKLDKKDTGSDINILKQPGTPVEEKTGEIIRHDPEAPPVIEEKKETNDRVITGKQKKLEPLDPGEGVAE
ncbi:MAG: hypothetical protein ACOCX9_05530 [Spirochaetota bacterium]